MKLLHANFCFLSVILAGILLSCQEDDRGYTYEEIKASVYQREFAAAFGTPDPNHSWGFIDQPVLNYAETETRTVNTQSNLWGDPNYYGLNVPADVTSAEAEWVYNWFATNQIPPSKSIHWSDFFIQYVSSWSEVHPNDARNMDQLGYEGILTSWEHVNDFNATTKTTKYVYNAGTENWTYRSSFDDKYHNNLYSIQYLSFTAKDGKHYEGWYIGLDYEAIVIEGNGSERTGSVHRDGYFCDWIVKVTPGTHQGYPISVRVMCEDLGNSFDWDFNDVVFDVSFVGVDQYAYYPVAKYKKYRATIVLRAVGGTLPIYVGTTDPRYEAHMLLGDGSMTPILNPAAPAIYTIDYDESVINALNNVVNAKMIPIYVGDEEITAINLSASNTPQRFACPDSVMWSEELKNICETYTNFPAWVTNEARFQDVKDLWKYNPKNTNNNTELQK